MSGQKVGAALVLLVLTVTAACGSQDTRNDSTGAPAVTSATVATASTVSPGSGTVVTTAPPTTSIPTKAVVVLLPTGLGVASFGDEMGAALASLTAALGPTTSDTGVVTLTPQRAGTFVSDPTDPAGLVFDRSAFRLVCWSAFCAAFGAADDGLVLTGWTWDAPDFFDASPEPKGLSTPEGVTLGSTVASLQQSYPQVTFDFGEGGVNQYAIAADGGTYSGRLTGFTTPGSGKVRPSPSEQVATMQSGDVPEAGCC